MIIMSVYRKHLKCVQERMNSRAFCSLYVTFTLWLLKEESLVHKVGTAHIPLILEI